MRYAYAMLIGLAPALASAAPIAFDEAVSGDIVSSSPFEPGATVIGPTFLLDVGSNTIRGRASYGVLPSDKDFDFFRIRVVDGQRIAGATLQWSAFAADGSLAAATFGPFALSPIAGGGRGAADSRALDFFGQPTGLASLWSADLPLGAGTYDLAYVVGIGRNQDATGTRWAVDYAWTFVVAPLAVPEPPMLGLLAVGILGLAFSRRRFPAS